MGAGVLGDVLLRQVMAPLADLLYRQEVRQGWQGEGEGKGRRSVC
jgi:hypothetical protein